MLFVARSGLLLLYMVTLLCVPGTQSGLKRQYPIVLSFVVCSTPRIGSNGVIYKRILYNFIFPVQKLIWQQYERGGCQTSHKFHILEIIEREKSPFKETTSRLKYAVCLS